MTRGVCHIKDNKLSEVTETYEIQMVDGKLSAKDDDGQDVEVELDSAVSMNMWGLHPKFIEVLDKGFEVFLEKLPESDIKKEYLLPRIIDRMLKSGEATVEVIRTDDKWFGVTYQEDKQIVIDSIRELISNGVYKEKLFS